MTVSVFLSHNSVDKPFVRRIATDLENHGVKVWIDEAEIKIGDSLIEKIRSGLDEVDYVVVILSPNSVSSIWVQRELDVAMTQEINGRQVKVLPLMYKKCDLPGFLLGKLYADFTEENKYSDSFSKLTRSIGIVFNQKAFNNSVTDTSLMGALDKAEIMNLPLCIAPFHRPFQYVGMKVADAHAKVGGIINEGGNIIVEDDECHMFLEVEGNYINYVEVDLIKTAPRYQNQEFDSIPILGALSISPTELEFIRKKTYFHTYYDHKRQLKVTVSCLYDGAPFTVGFSAKYYGE
ncbi:toll/interleukin-1 receptor domain-containing protein [Budvicia aquatica]|uniref:toll/interleukin-1 receptor domain-containing protein n=1 Tax=Budvicia aquatica TaxID=82979 RepID=UPI002086D328|nr:toll/interleukin-1 receptor domain-containing protein [Budvicia aquatica]GKX50627.1 hypothetical protein SOASR029_09360 [Budvicia aquatica]